MASKCNIKKWCCAKCGKASKTNVIWCNSCENWNHRHCEKLSKVDFKFCGKSKTPYVCCKCSETNGVFDYMKGLKRLKKAAIAGNLNQCALMEIIISKKHSLDYNHDSSENQKIDKISALILKHFGKFISLLDVTCFSIRGWYLEILYVPASCSLGAGSHLIKKKN